MRVKFDVNVSVHELASHFIAIAGDLQTIGIDEVRNVELHFQCYRENKRIIFTDKLGTRVDAIDVSRSHIRPTVART